MSFQLIDYSEHYFRELAGEPVPESRGGKFVQIRDGNNDREYLVLSPGKLSMYHANIVERFCKLKVATRSMPKTQENANIVERFCKLKGLDGHWNAGRISYKIVDDSWSVVGGGRWVIDSGKKTLELGSSSQAYGRFDSAGLVTNILSLNEMKGYAVKIEDL